MAALVVPNFVGMFPRRGLRLLEDNMAAVAANTLLTNGYVRGRNADVLLTELPAPARKIRRVIAKDGREGYLTFVTPDVDIVQAPLVNDQFARYYWAGEGFPPGFSTAERIINGDTGYRLGVLPPEAPPVVTNEGGGTDPQLPAESRAYAYTYVDVYGQESQPSPPSALLSIRSDETAEVTFTAGAAPVDYPELAFRRLYRTVPGAQGVAQFFFVADVPIATLVFTDDNDTSVVALNETMPSADWTPPPEGLAGMAALPNGFLVGFRGRDVLFSEPYLPHAWPSGYTLSVEDDIVGLAVFDTNVVILTKGVPQIATGVAPESMSLIKVGPTNACVSRRSIVAMPGAVVYASEDGLNAVSVGGNDLLTRPMIDRDAWRRDYKPERLLAARDGEARYIGFFSDTLGFMLDFREPELGLSFVSTTAGDGTVVGLDEDAEGRSAIMLDGAGVATIFSAAVGMPQRYTWRSKEFFATRPMNIGAGQVNVDPKAVPFAAGDVTFRLWANGLPVAEQVIPLGKAFRLPTGYKAQVFQFELDTDQPISRVVLTEAPRELAAY
jgi:hypothetical protein